MRDRAASLMTLQHVIPAATVSFLASRGMDADVSVSPVLNSTIHAARA